MLKIKPCLNKLKTDLQHLAPDLNADFDNIPCLSINPGSADGFIYQDLIKGFIPTVFSDILQKSTLNKQDVQSGILSAITDFHDSIQQKIWNPINILNSKIATSINKLARNSDRFNNLPPLPFHSNNVFIPQEDLAPIWVRNSLVYGGDWMDF